MKRKEQSSNDDVDWVVTSCEDPEPAEQVISQENVEPSDDSSSIDEASLEDIPVATTEESAHGEVRSGWRLFSSEDLPQLTLREILGGDYLLGSFLRKNIWFILLLVLLGIFYISNRYAAQQEIIEEEELRNELIEKKNYALTQYAELTMNSRQSNIERKLKASGDSLLMSSTEPPFVIRVEK